MPRIECTGNTEVDHLDGAVVAHQNICGLNVAVHHIVAVCIGKSIGNGSSNTSGRLCGHAAVAAQCFRQCAALHEFHSHEIGVAGLAPVVHAHNVRVVQAGHALGFAAEALHKVRVDGVLGEQHFHGYLAVEQ